MAKATLIATLTEAPTPEQILSIPASVDWIEVRADLTGDLNAAWLRQHFPGRLLYSLPSAANEGRFEGSAHERGSRLTNAARDYDLIDLDGRCDLSSEVLEQIPAYRRVISWSGAASDSSALAAEFDRLSSVPAVLYKLATTSSRPGEELAPLCFLNSLGRKDVMAYSVGDVGFWTRLIAPLYGAPLVYGVAGSHRQSMAAEPTIRRLIDDYGLPELPQPEEIYGIVGSPVRHSLSPRLHNAAYRAAGLAAVFLPFHVESFDEFWSEVVTGKGLQSLGLSIKGLTVASPHKEVAIGMAGTASPMVRRACSSNVMARRNGGWVAETTDPEGVVLALAKRSIDVRDKCAAIVGCGGAGRAIAAALDLAGAKVTLVNRGLERGDRASELLGLPFIRLSEFNPQDFSVIVNATPVGRGDNQMPFAIDGLSSDAIIADLVYARDPTPLVRAAMEMGKKIITGQEVLLIQVRRQFRLMTGHEMSEELARKILACESEVACAASAGPSHTTPKATQSFIEGPS
jgi:3-dehydroquinate dehydratase / shikimate dehydrogenase